MRPAFLVMFVSVFAVYGSAGCRGSADDRLAAHVRQRLAIDPAIAAATIEVTAESGVVRLRGTVPSEKVAQHAIFVAQQVDGVSHVTADLRLEPMRPRREQLAPLRHQP
jgi:osmotically-inducible protein OsmY